MAESKQMRLVVGLQTSAKLHGAAVRTGKTVKEVAARLLDWACGHMDEATLDRVADGYEVYATGFTVGDKLRPTSEDVPA